MCGTSEHERRVSPLQRSVRADKCGTNGKIDGIVSGKTGKEQDTVRVQVWLGLRGGRS